MPEKSKVKRETAESMTKHVVESAIKHVVESMVSTMLSLKNADILYALLRASELTKEKITPERLIESAGLYSPPNSLRRVKYALNNLRGMAFVFKDGKAYNLTEAGISAARFLDSFLQGIVSYSTLKNRLPGEIRAMYEAIPEKSRENYLNIYRRFRRIDEKLRRGI